MQTAKSCESKTYALFTFKLYQVYSNVFKTGAENVVKPKEEPKVATVLGSNPASSDTLESDGRYRYNSVEYSTL
jgi:hypothetical protein